MAHYALLDENNVVIKVITGRHENDLDPNTAEVVDWEQEYAKICGFPKCKRTSYNTRLGSHYKDIELSQNQEKTFRKNYAMPGFTYDESLDAFIFPQPFPSWTLNTETGNWNPPVPYPDDGNEHTWNEDTQEWELRQG
jgi:hypothetical protein